MENRYESCETAWCPGCGNFAILEALTQVLNELALERNRVVLVGGIGQAAKLNQYMNVNGFSGLHGRAIPAAVGIKIVNDGLTVIVNTGDGDSYGEGGNHFLHNLRRNVDITHFVHNNQIYGLTKGQPSPTSDACEMDHKTKACNMSETFNPLLIAIASGATFVARSFSGNRLHLKKIMKAAILHKGYALVDILQPCVSFNKINTFAYYKSRTYELTDDYDCSDKLLAVEKSMEYGDKIPIGIIYQKSDGLTHALKRPTLFDGTPILHKRIDTKDLQSLLNTFI